MNFFIKYLTLIIFLVCLVQICFFTQRHQFGVLFPTYAVFFGTYLLVLKNANATDELSFFIKVSILLRGVALFSFPNLSDDIYRFLWDGHLINLGENPFNHTPQYYIQNQLFADVLTPDLFYHLNSPNYYSVYPTVCQSVFASAVFLFPKNIYWATFIIKLFLWTCEVGTILLMKKLISTQQTLIYALNPFVIIELVGNAHFEAAMIFFFILAVCFTKKIKDSNRPNLYILFSTIAFSLSVVSKMLPLMFLPLFLKKLGWKRSVQFWISIAILLIILLLPIYNSLFISNIGNSLGLYFKQFEFNASIFYLIKAFGIWLYGYNIIGQATPVLSFFVVLFILWRTFRPISAPVSTDYTEGWFEDFLYVIFAYFALATTVHPWYVAMPLALSVFTKWRFVVVWSFLIFLTYAGYTEGSSKHSENIVFLVIEYLVIYSYFFFELCKKKASSSSF